MKAALSILVFMVLSGCAIAPLSEDHTARTLGEGNKQWGFTAGYLYYSAAFTKGVNERLDLGGIVESQYYVSLLVGVNGKYLLAPLEDRNPWALLFGAGVGTNSSYGYLGLIKSFRLGSKYELAINSRFNVYNWNFNDGKESDDAEDFFSDLVNGSIESVEGTHMYVSYDLSNTWWFTQKFGATLSLGGLTYLGEDTGTGFKGGLKFHFNY